MRAAGYVLVGGRSSRMGRDKALLPFGPGTLTEYVAAQVRAAAGNVTLIGDRERYSHLGMDVIPDRLPGNGPLGGIAAAVSAAGGWALVVACDMPNVTSDLLRSLICAAADAHGAAECVLPKTGTGYEPLCALYHSRALPILDSFLNHKFLKMRDVVLSLQAVPVEVADPALFRNLNTPQDLQAHE